MPKHETPTWLDDLLKRENITLEEYAFYEGYDITLPDWKSRFWADFWLELEGPSEWSEAEPEVSE